jgi:hypothetical protein
MSRVEAARSEQDKKLAAAARLLAAQRASLSSSSASHHPSNSFADYKSHAPPSSGRASSRRSGSSGHAHWIGHESSSGHSHANDDYAVLGLANGAPLEAVKAAFRRHAIHYHPDQMLRRSTMAAASSADSSAETQVQADAAKFIRIRQAYENIMASDATKNRVR